MKTLLKILLLNIIVISNTSVLIAQSTVWRQILGEQYNEIGRDVIELRDHGYLMVGEKQINPTGTTSLIYQTYLVKLDRYGNIEWQKIIGDSIFNNVSYAVTEDTFGNLYIPYGGFSSNPHLIKLNSIGTILWDRSYSFANIAFFVGISFVDNYKNLMLVGQNRVSTILTSALTKLDSSGNLIWTKEYYDSIPSLYSYSSYSNCYLFTDKSYFLSGNIGINGFIIKTDTSGNRIWTKRYTQAQYILSIVKNSENTFIATGAARNFGTYCLKYDNYGDTLWTKNYSSETFGYNKIVGIFNCNFAIGTNGGGNITRVGIIDSLGNIISIYRNLYPINVDMSYENFNYTSDSGLIFTGYYSIFQNGGHPLDVLIDKIDKKGNMVIIKNSNLETSEKINIKTFPNPYNLSFSLNFNLTKTSKVKIDLFDLSGKKVREIENSILNFGDHYYNINTPELSSGIYFIVFENSDIRYSTKILLIK